MAKLGEWTDGSEYDFYGETAQDKSDRVKSAQLTHRMDQINDKNSHEYAKARQELEDHYNDMGLRNESKSDTQLKLNDLDYAKSVAEKEAKMNGWDPDPLGGYTTPASRFRANGGWKGFWQKAGTAGLKALTGDYVGALNTFSNAKVMPHDFNQPTGEYREAQANKRNFSLGFGLQGNKASLNTQIGNLSKNFELKPSTKAMERRANRIVDTGWDKKTPVTMQYETFDLQTPQLNDLNNQRKFQHMITDQIQPEIEKKSASNSFKVGSDTSNKKMTDNMKKRSDIIVTGADSAKKFAMNRANSLASEIKPTFEQQTASKVEQIGRDVRQYAADNKIGSAPETMLRNNSNYDSNKSYDPTSLADLLQGRYEGKDVKPNKLPDNTPDWAKQYAERNPQAWNNYNNLAKRNGQDSGKVINARNDYYQQAIKDGYTPEEADNIADSKMVSKLIESGVKAAEAASTVASLGSLNTAIGLANQSRNVIQRLAREGMTEAGKRKVLQQMGVKVSENASKKAVEKAFSKAMTNVAGATSKAVMSRGAKTAASLLASGVINNAESFAGTEPSGVYDSYNTRNFDPINDPSVYTDVDKFRNSPYYTPEGEEIFNMAKTGSYSPESRSTVDSNDYIEEYVPSDYSNNEETSNFDQETSDRNMEELTEEEKEEQRRAMQFDAARDRILEMYGIDIAEGEGRANYFDNQKNGYVANSKFGDNLSYLIADDLDDEANVQQFNQELTDEEFMDFIKANPWVADLIANNFGQQ